MVLIVLSSSRQLPAQDFWTNPNGGSWADGGNWSKGAAPTVAGLATQFSLGSQLGYTVTNIPANLNPVVVDNDNLTMNFGGVSSVFGIVAVGFQLNASTGHVSSLTLINGQAEPYGGNYIGYGPAGSGGVVNLNLQQFELGTYMGAMEVGAAGGTVNYNQTGGNLFSARSGVDVATGAANVNVSINNGNVSGGGSISFGSAGYLTASLKSTYVNPGQYSGSGSLTIGTSTGIAMVAANNSTFSVNGTFSLGTGGGTGTLLLTNSILYPQTLVIGASGGTGTLIDSGAHSVVTSILSDIAVGDGGTGQFNLSGGAALVCTAPAYIGGAGGSGTMILSGPGTVWNSSGHTSTSQAQNNIFIGTDGISQGTGLLELDHYALLNLMPSIPSFGSPIPASINLSSGGTVQILSGARVNAGYINEVSGSTLEIGLDSADTSANGLMNLSNTATFAGTLDVVVENGFQPAVGESFQLFNFGGETGQFYALNLPAPYTWDVSALYTTGTITVTAVPELATLPLLLSALVFSRRRVGANRQLK